MNKRITISNENAESVCQWSVTGNWKIKNFDNSDGYIFATDKWDNQSFNISPLTS